MNRLSWEATLKQLAKKKKKKKKNSLSKGDRGRSHLYTGIWIYRRSSKRPLKHGIWRGKGGCIDMASFLPFFFTKESRLPANTCTFILE